MIRKLKRRRPIACPSHSFHLPYFSHSQSSKYTEMYFMQVGTNRSSYEIRTLMTLFFFLFLVAFIRLALAERQAVKLNSCSQSFSDDKCNFIDSQVANEVGVFHNIASWLVFLACVVYFAILAELRHATKQKKRINFIRLSNHTPMIVTYRRVYQYSSLRSG